MTTISFADNTIQTENLFISTTQAQSLAYVVDDGTTTEFGSMTVVKVGATAKLQIDFNLNQTFLSNTFLDLNVEATTDGTDWGLKLTGLGSGSKTITFKYDVFSTIPA